MKICLGHVLSSREFLLLFLLPLCVSPKNATNVTTTLRLLRKEWFPVPEVLTQFDISPDDTIWGVNSADEISIRNGNVWSQVDGVLNHVTVGKAGVWGVTVRRTILYREGVTLNNPNGSSWTQIRGELDQIDSGPSGIVYGVNHEQKIFCRIGITLSKPEGTDWEQVPGTGKYVSCGVYGCWGVDDADQIWFRYGVTPNNCAGNLSVSISGNLNQLEVDNEGKVYGIYNKQIYVRDGVSSSLPNGTNWRHIPSRPFIHISAGDYNIVALNSSGAIYYYRDWFLAPNEMLTQLDISPDDIIWGVDSAGQIFTRNGGAWRQVVGLLKHVTVGKAGVWGLTVSGTIFYRAGVTLSNPMGSSWTQIPGVLMQIDSGPSGIVYAVTQNLNVFCRYGITLSGPKGTGWVQLPGTARYVSCGIYGCWGVDNADQIWFRYGVSSNNCAGNQSVTVSGNLNQLECDLNTDIPPLQPHVFPVFRFGKFV